MIKSSKPAVKGIMSRNSSNKTLPGGESSRNRYPEKSVSKFMLKFGATSDK